MRTDKNETDMMKERKTDMNVYSDALEALRNGGVLLYPTDTVWGLGCDATNPEAVRKVYGIKRRPDSKSLVLLASDLDMVARYIREIPEMAVQLVEVNDRPMTIIYPDALTGPDCRGLADNVVAEDGSVGIRIPMADFCRDLVRRFGRPIVSTSANISGEPAPKRFADIPQSIKDSVDCILDPSLERQSSGKASSIIKVGIDGTIDIIRK